MDERDRSTGTGSSSFLPSSRWIRASALLGMVWAVAASAGCGDGTTPPDPEPQNRPPVATGAIPAQTVFAGDVVTVDLSAYFSDPDGDALTYSAASSDGGVATASVSGSIVTVAGVAKGTATVTATAVDPNDLSAQQSFSTTVPNRSPEALEVIPDLEVQAGDTARIVLSAYFTDPDGDTLSYDASVSDAGIATVGISGDTLVVVGISRDTATVVVTARDTDELSVEQSFSVVVPNRSPVGEGSIPDRVLQSEDTLTVDLSGYFSDPDGDTLQYTVETSSSGVATASADGSNARVIGVARGSATVTVTASDPHGLSAEQTFSVMVPNSPPRTTEGIRDRELQAGTSITVDLSLHFTDPDGDSLSYTAAVSDPGVATVSLSDGRGTVLGVAPGTATITARASDPDGLFAEQSFSVHVETRRPPEVALVTGAVAAPEGGTIQLEVSAHPPPLAPILVRYSVGVDDDEATPDADAADYAHAATGTLQIDSGAVGAAIEIGIVDDDDIEPTREVFTIVLDTPAEDAPYTLGRTSLATGTILEGVCDRTPQVRDEIARTAAVRCEDVADSHLETIDTLNLVPPGERPEDPHSSQGPPVTDMRTENCTRATRIAPAADGRGPSLKRMRGCPFSMRFGIPGEHSLRAGNAGGGAREPVTELQIGDFAGLAGLQELWLQYNELKRLEPGIFSELAELRVLYLNNNGFETLDSDLFSGLERLQELTLYNNGLTELPADVFANLSALEGIWLHDNEFATLPPELFSNLRGLRELLLHANQLSELPAGSFSSLESLEVLALNSNQLTELDGNVFENLSSLEQLGLGENLLGGLPTGAFANLGSLEELVLDRNRLTGLPSGIFAGLEALQGLFLSENQIAEIQPGAFSGLSSLEGLFLSDNRLTNLQRGTFDDLSSLKTLVMERNPLAQLKSGLFSELANLEELWLNEAGLTSVVPATFSGLSALRVLNLAQNQLTELYSGSLEGLSGLEDLWIQQNRIATLGPGYSRDSPR